MFICIGPARLRKPNKPRFKARGGLDVYLNACGAKVAAENSRPSHQLQATIDDGLFYPFFLCCPFEKTLLFPRIYHLDATSNSRHPQYQFDMSPRDPKENTTDSSTLEPDNRDNNTQNPPPKKKRRQRQLYSCAGRFISRIIIGIYRTLLISRRMPEIEAKV